jgi:hypothetical protein
MAGFFFLFILFVLRIPVSASCASLFPHPAHSRFLILRIL